MKEVLFFAKQDCWAVDFALRALETMNVRTHIYKGLRGQPFPEGLEWLGSDLIVSFLSPWIIPAKVLKSARAAAINFHPGPPEYPGIGCTNFALYNGETRFGVTCHRMAEKVDTGEICAVRTFPIFQDDDVKALTERCYAHLCELFVYVMNLAVFEDRLPLSNLKWTREPYTRRELDALATVTPDMAPEEMQRRIKATTYPGYQPQIQIGERRYPIG